MDKRETVPHRHNQPLTTHTHTHSGHTHTNNSPILGGERRRTKRRRGTVIYEEIFQGDKRRWK